MGKPGKASRLSEPLPKSSPVHQPRSSQIPVLGLLDPKEGWVLKKWCFPIVVLEKTLENPLDSKAIKPVNPKGNQPWMFIGRTGDAEAEYTILWPPDVKSQLIGKNPDARKDWGQEEKVVAEDEIDIITDSMDVNLSKLWEIVKDRSLTCWGPWGPKELDMTYWLNNSKMVASLNRNDWLNCWSVVLDLNLQPLSPLQGWDWNFFSFYFLN